MCCMRKEYPRPDFDEMISAIASLAREFDISFDNSCRIFVDSNNPSFIRALKDRLDEDPGYEIHIENLKRNLKQSYSLELLERSMFVIPVHFSKEHKNMLAQWKNVLEYHGDSIAIHPQSQSS
jgi:hypothetical protein